MKIARIETFPLFYPLSQPYGDANGMKNYRSCFIFRITTHSGLTGWGECADWLPSLVKGFEERIIPFLTGKSAADRTKLVHHIKKWHRRSAAGVSMALTEIAAKAAGFSVCDLWGGKWRDSIPVYASFQSYSDQPAWINHSVHLVNQATEQGFTRIKVKIGGRAFEEDRQHIQRVQDAIKGKGQLILDANQSYDMATTRRWEKDFANWTNLLWLEEPMPMDRVSDYKQLRSCLSVAIAGGENVKSASGFLPLLCDRAIDIIQPDIAHEDGIDGFRHVLQLSRTFGLRASPHTFDGALSRLYTLFAQACLPPWSKMSEEDTEPVEWDAMESRFASLVPIKPAGGCVQIPAGPGIGVELDEETLHRYRWDGSIYH